MSRKTKADGSRVGTDVKQLPVTLTQEELLDFGQRLARQNTLISDHSAHASAVKKDLKSKEEALSSERARLASIVRDKAEVRDVRVEIHRDYSARKYREVRDDTGEAVFERPLRPDELQGELLDEGGVP